MTVANTNISFKNNIDYAAKNKIVDIVNSIYGKCNYINKIDEINYSGDMGCLCVLGTRIIKFLSKNNLLQYLSKYIVFCTENDYKEDMLEDE